MINLIYWNAWRCYYNFEQPRFQCQFDAFNYFNPFFALFVILVAAKKQMMIIKLFDK